MVKGLKRQKVKTFDEAIFLMNYGEDHRMYRETNFHEHSSRSHTIFQVVNPTVKNNQLLVHWKRQEGWEWSRK